MADLNRLCGLVQHALERNTSAKAAVEIALYDLWAQGFGAPLYQLLGGGTPRVTTDITISADTIATMVAQAQAALAHGYRALKIKVGKDIESDVERVTAIHAAVAGRHRCGWMPIKAGRPNKRCAPCVRWKMAASRWSCWSSRSKPPTSTGSPSSPHASTRR
ncbi:hypothetical protein XAP6164_3120013 [Xanthomonas phaseoli pv. phaseoli]|nr:hypothetical protein XAP6164_3120013 [Xanthomonas phaseoli pv. phaseoli]